MFSIFFVMIAVTRAGDPEHFLRAQATLNRALGLTNTLLLLTSSLLVAQAVDRIRERQNGAQWLLHGATACGCGFVAIKALEYGEKISAGIGFTSGDFFTYYFAFTGIHLAHVVLGLVVLGLINAAAREPLTQQRASMIEGGAIFWHLVDLLWIMLFALFYLAG